MLHNAPIRSRFAFTLIVPLLGLAVLAVAGIRSDLVESARAARVHRLARFGVELAPVIHGLQDERSLSGNYLAVGRRAGAAELAAQRRAVDRSIAACRAAAGRLRLGRGDAAVLHKLDAVMDALGKLPIQRRTIGTSPITPADERVQPLIAPQERGEPPARAGDVPNRLGTPREALDRYTVTIGALIQLNAEIAAGTDNQRLLDGIDAQLAGKEAALRRSIGDMFLNLARRSQSLIDRQLEVIGTLPDATTAELPTRVLELDQLATRMRRNAENLIVLSGAEPTRRWRGPVGIGRVVGAAVEEVKEATRVEVLPLQDAPIAGHAAGGVVHLLVELIENALRFSPPETTALIAGQSLPAGYLIEIEDRGIGMSDQQLARANERLANPPAVDLARGRMLGLFVVGQPAARHGIKVQLRRSRYAGVTALVLLPAGRVVQPDPLAAAGGRPSQGDLAAAKGSRPT